ncbi:MAG: gas vesicle protein GvpJ [Thermoleophilaceae bacterium]|jgi:gas vesicle structural protein
MTTQALATRGNTGQRLGRAPNPSGLAEVVDLILDKGLVIDLYVRVSLVGIEVLTIDARIVVASVDTYLRFAEAVNRLDLTETGDSEGLPEMIGDLEEGGAKKKTKGALEGAKGTLSDIFSGGDDEDEDEQDEGDEEEEDDEERKPRRRRQAAPRRRRTSSSDGGRRRRARSSSRE